MVDIKGLTVALDGKVVLKGIDLAVGEGKTFGVIGPSGCGKTSLLKAIMGLIRPLSGAVVIFGEDITKLTESGLNLVRRKMGMVFQYSALFDSMDVFENVAFPLRQHTKLKDAEIAQIVSQKLSVVGLEGYERLLPEQLSGGMQKRVGIARALALEPQLVLYDEPTSGLDPVVARAIDDLILALQSRFAVTSIVVSHDVMSIFRVSDEVAFMYEGEIMDMGTPEELMQSSSDIIRAFVADVKI